MVTDTRPDRPLPAARRNPPAAVLAHPFLKNSILTPASSMTS
jgi:hypothetical protein